MDAILTTGIMAAAVVAGVAIAVVTSRNKNRTELVDWRKEQLVVDTFDAAQAKAWFLEKCGGDTVGKQMLAALLTEDMQKQLEISGEVLDRDHYLILAILEKNTPKQYQLVNFGRLEDTFLQMLHQNGGKLLVQG